MVVELIEGGVVEAYGSKARGFVENYGRDDVVNGSLTGIRDIPNLGTGKTFDNIYNFYSARVFAKRSIFANGK